MDKLQVLSLKTLFENAQVPSLSNQVSRLSLSPQIIGMITDSRQVQPGDLFIGLPGTHVDGGKFWRQALDQGAVALLISDSVWHTEAAAIQTYQRPVLILPAPEIMKASAQLAAAFYGFPGRQLHLIGVTGTNGKTTTTHLIEHLLRAVGISTGLMGTLYTRWPGGSAEAQHTTPFPLDLQRQLARLQQEGCTHAVMEVSSHALAQDRVWGCQFQAAVWTNLTQDHLDFHETMENYWQAKARLFQSDYFNGSAVINVDDPGGQRLWQSWPAEVPNPWGYSLQSPHQSEIQPHLWPTQIELAADHIQTQLQTPVGEIRVSVPIPGQFNLANTMAAIGVVLRFGLTPDQIETALPQFPGVPGRMEAIQIPDQDITVLVDYAHTPDGLENVLRAVRPLVQGRLCTVFGCGGDRDRTKRPQMGRIAATWSDQVVVTSDNPRTEDPQGILMDILAGIDPQQTPTHVEVDRRTAILETILAAAPGDTVVIAGKGHEDYQILGTTKIHFDDREVAREALRLRGQQNSGN
ncbi:MAG: UDP-N-acetylmuramoyl-L-alanyl-D-glutamate--2,6-diaminopimelate ligase [Synechococcaceae cyanobacterium SM2_3_1]|nr:UDP-N-acetylmuramoyl-L-alanyl-D-glutamate--2,6-diaminopimelate ligase [Synechococcaceae cyanobacterium SM2_3_1]